MNKKKTEDTQTNDGTSRSSSRSRRGLPKGAANRPTLLMAVDAAAADVAASATETRRATPRRKQQGRKSDVEPLLSCCAAKFGHGRAATATLGLMAAALLRAVTPAVCLFGRQVVDGRRTSKDERPRYWRRFIPLLLREQLLLLQLLLQQLL